jgi:tetratricopeptide (TPR) repeat protein
MQPNIKPIELRLKRIEDNLYAEPKKKLRFAWLTDPARLTSLAALIISLTTTFHSWRKDTLQSQEDRRKQFDSAIEQLIDNGLKNYEYVKNNRSAENFGAMSSWFTSQAMVMRDKAASSMVGLENVTTGQYILVGTAMINAGQPLRAAKLYQMAIDLAHAKRDVGYVDRVKAWLGISALPEPDAPDFASVNELASAYTSLGQAFYALDKYDDAAQQYRNAMNTYRDSSVLSDSVKYESYAYVHKFWAESLAQKGECGQSREHFMEAAASFPQGRKNPNDPDWGSIQYGISWATQCLATPQNVSSLPSSTPFPQSK